MTKAKPTLEQLIAQCGNAFKILCRGVGANWRTIGSVYKKDANGKTQEIEMKADGLTAYSSVEGFLSMINKNK